MKRRIVTKELVWIGVIFSLLLLFAKTGLKEKIQNANELKQNVRLALKNTEKEAASSYGVYFKGVFQELDDIVIHR